MTPSQLRATLDNYARFNPGESAMVARILDILRDDFGDLTQRSAYPAHITASVLILQGDSLLTIWHPHLKQWIQPGGHVDAGETVLAAAFREAREETGLTCDLVCDLAQSSDMPFDIDCLWVPENPRKGEPGHWHIDFRYLMRPSSGMAVTEPELPTACVPLKHLGEMSPSLARLADKLQAHLVMA